MEKRNRKKGSITVEAALVLPIFILVIYTFGMVMKLIYVHDMMQQALTETAEDIAVAGYVYEQSGLLEVQRHLDKAFKDQPDLNEEFQTMTLDVGSELELVSTQASQGFAVVKNEGTDLISKFKNLQTTIIGLSESFTSMYSSIQGFVDQVTVNSLLAPDYIKAKSYVGGAVTKMQFRRYLTNDQLKVLGIKGGIRGLGFKRSQLFYEEGDQQDLIFLVMDYEVSIPSFMNLLSEVKLVNTVKTRGWTGAGEDVGSDNDKDSGGGDESENLDQAPDENSSQEDADEEQDQSEDEGFVYLGNRGTDGKIIYHDPKTCNRLEREKDVKSLFYKSISKESVLCAKCEKRSGGISNLKDSTTIYVTLANMRKDKPTIHTYMRCSYIYLNKSRKKPKKEVEESNEYRSCNCL